MRLRRAGRLSRLPRSCVRLDVYRARAVDVRNVRSLYSRWRNRSRRRCLLLKSLHARRLAEDAMDQGTVVCRMCGCEMVERSRFDICHWCGMAMVEGSEERALAEAGLLSEPEEAQWERTERIDPVQAWLDSQARERARSLALEIAQEQAPALSTE